VLLLAEFFLFSPYNEPVEIARLLRSPRPQANSPWANRRIQDGVRNCEH